MPTFSLEVTALHAWQHGRQVLHDVTLRARPGELVALIGPTDAGPDALLHAILGLSGARVGSIRLAGNEAIHLSPPNIRQLGVAQCHLGPHGDGHDTLSCEEQLLMPEPDGPPLGGGWSLADLYRSFPTLLRHRHTPTTELPADARLLLPIARAMRHGADLLLISVPAEPSRHADVITQLLPGVCRAVLDRHHTVVLACSQPAVAQLASQRIHMRAGRVLPSAGQPSGPPPAHHAGALPAPR